VRAWRQRHACRASDDPVPWLRVIARREALRLAGERRHEPVEDALERLAGPSHEAEVVRSADLRQALAGLREDDRRLLVWRFWGDLPHCEVAERLGVSETAAKVRLHRLCTQLRGVAVEQA
jgi:RNA polymerase sigma factor (sigma-70 family)